MAEFPLVSYQQISRNAAKYRASIETQELTGESLYTTAMLDIATDVFDKLSDYGKFSCLVAYHDEYRRHFKLQAARKIFEKHRCKHKNIVSIMGNESFCEDCGEANPEIG